VEPSGAIEPFAKLLGTVPDRTIAKKAGVSVRVVANYRASVGVAGYQTAHEPKRRGRRSKIEPFVGLFDTVSDAIIAEKAGVGLNAVRTFRRVRGIPSVQPAAKAARVPAVNNPPPSPPSSTTPRQTRGSAASSAHPVTVPSATRVEPDVVKTPPSARQWAWQVELVNGRSGVVMGSCLTAAVERAQRVGEVSAMTRIGVVL
jgi:hypothetical protein